MFAMHYGLYNGEFMTHQQIADEFNITKSRVGQIMNKTLSKLRHPARINLFKYMTDEEVGYKGKGYAECNFYHNSINVDEDVEEIDNSQLENTDDFFVNIKELLDAKKNKIANARIDSLTDEQKQAKIILDILLTRECSIYTKKMEEDLYGSLSARLFSYKGWSQLLEMNMDKFKRKGYQYFINQIHSGGLYFKEEFKYVEDWENAIYKEFINKGLDNIRKEFNIPKIGNVKDLNTYSLLETHIEDLDLSVRAYNCLKRAGVDTLGGLISKSEQDLNRVRNLGRRCFDEITDKVKSLGLELRPKDITKEMWILQVCRIPITNVNAIYLIESNTIEEVNLIDEAPKKVDKKNRFDSLLSIEVEELDISVRAYNCLKRAGINNVRDLICNSQMDLFKNRNLGIISLEEIVDKVKSLGLALRPENMSSEDWIKQLKQKISARFNSELQVKQDINQIHEKDKRSYAVNAGMIAQQEVKKDAMVRLISRDINSRIQANTVQTINSAEKSLFYVNATNSTEQPKINEASSRLITEMISSYNCEEQKEIDKKVLGIISEDVSVIDCLEDNYIIKNKDALMKIVLKDKNLDAEKRLELINMVYNTEDNGDWVK
jgi:DNA-directed RNA polymerase alpha subunit